MDWLRLRRADWQRFCSLTRYEQRLLALSLIGLSLLVMVHRLFGLARTSHFLGRITPGYRGVRSPDWQTLCRARCISKIVRIAGNRCLFRSTCLQQSFFLGWILERRGVAAALYLGVKKKGSLFEGHAWVEYLGYTLNDRADVRSRFAAFAEPARVWNTSSI